MRKRKITDSPISDHSDTEPDVEEEDDGEYEQEEEEDVGISSPPSGEISTPTAALYCSVCTSSHAKRYAIEFKVPPEYNLCAPTADQRAHAPPPGYAAIYTHHFLYGLRLPLPPFVVSLLDHYEIALAQLYPASIVSVLGFMEVCKKVSISPTPTLFRRFFRLHTISKRGQHAEGWYTFYSIPPKIVYGQPSGVKKWRKSFLFFKTAPVSEMNVALSWNHSLIVDPPLADNEKPSEQTVSRFRANADRSFKALRSFSMRKEEERMVEEDSSMASVPKSRNSKKKAVAHRIQPKKPSKENEPTLVPCATVKPKTTSTELLTASCRLKRMTELPAAKPAEALRVYSRKKCLIGSSQVLSVPSLLHISPAKAPRASNLHLQEDKEKLENVVAALDQDVKVKDHEISSLKAELSRLQVVMDSEIASLQGEKEELEQGLKEKDSLIASLQGEKKELENKIVAVEQGIKDKENKVPLLQGDRDREKFVKVVAAMVQGIKDKVSEMAFSEHAN